MPCKSRHLANYIVYTSLSLALSVGLTASSYAAVPPVNTVNNGQVVQNGTYYNTPGDKTTFINTAGTGLFIKANTTVTGLEATVGKNGLKTTGNGGNLLFNVPGQVVRLDGVINVNALSKQGAFIGNGGRVTINAGYLYQSGQISALGRQGGSINLNVGSLTMTHSARINAQGESGAGGVVKIGTRKTDGVIDIQKGALIDTSGETIGSFDTNLISIQGGLINIDGVLRADGVNRQTGQSAFSNTFRLSESHRDPGKGGTILLVAKGNTKPIDPDLLTPKFMKHVKDQIIVQNTALIKKSGEGWVRIGKSGKLSANGSDGFSENDRKPVISVGKSLQSENASDRNNNNSQDGSDGGLISILAKCGIENNGLISANGGNGSDASRNNESNNKKGESTSRNSWNTSSNPGDGGDGGTILLTSGNRIINNGTIRANGGNGGDAAKRKKDCEYQESRSKEEGRGENEGEGHFSYLGKGGKGGHGGKITLISPKSPEGHGKYLVKGGRFGDGWHTTGRRAHDGKVRYFRSHACYTCETEPDTVTVTEANENLGLFQELRPVPINPLKSPDFPIIVALKQKNMFFSKTYHSITQEILNKTLRQYHEKLVSSNSEGFASGYAIWFLKQSGVDATIAKAILSDIQKGNMTVKEPLTSFLQKIADNSAVSLLNE